MKHIFTLFLGLAAAPAFAQSATDETAVRGAITQFFDAMRKADSTALKDAVLPGARLQTVLNRQGQVSVKDDDFSKFVASVGKAKPGALDERLGTYDVKIDGDLATAFTPYSFYYNGQQSHCGSNAFTLVRINGAWKVQAIIDTRRKCN
ncbi:DUF4440 domain-containing protein [Rudanella lutea]|uniref:DUF4440 domain-containing protein n=1 Tax=Rudanella lutea TaxID=451374 RepID=UPI00037CE378|nr:DUF4440 domain-containing protein [Rudanella lutea]